MASDALAKMIESLEVTRKDGKAFALKDGWELTIHAGRPGAMISVQQITRIELQGEFMYAQTRKDQRVTFWIDEIRGLTAEPTEGHEKLGRRPGFVG